MFDVITIGSALRDIFLQSKNFQIKQSFFSFPLGDKIEVERILFETGGGGTNTAFTFAYQGLKTAVFTRLGDDLGGRQIFKELKEAKIETKFIQKTKESTGYSTVLLTPSGQRAILIYRGASAFFKEIPLNQFKTKWLYISSLAGNYSILSKIIDWGYRNKVKIAFNPGKLELKLNLFPLFEKIDFLLLNKEEASFLTKKKDVIKMFKKLSFIPFSAITQGDQGAYFSSQKEIFFSKALGKKVVNTTGAGDAFGSGFVSGLILKNDPIYAFKLAIINSGMVVAEMGAKKGILRKEPGRELLNKIKVKRLNVDKNIQNGILCIH